MPDNRRTARWLWAPTLSLSSTAIVLALLSHQGRLATGVGRTVFSVLLAQDLAVLPILVFIPVAGAAAAGSVLGHVGAALLKATVAVAALVVAGRLLLRPLFRLVAGTRASELFVAASLFVIVGAGLAAHQAGLSMALGAFVAGLMLAETEYGRAIEVTIAPFKDLLLGIFFFTVGMTIDVREFVREPGWLLAAVATVIAGKALVMTVLGRLFRLPWASALEAGLLLAPIGEFAFVSLNMAAANALISTQVSRFAVAVTAITMALTPLLAFFGRWMATRFAAPRPVEPELQVRPPKSDHQAIVVGHGRVGKVVCGLLEQQGISYLAIDHDATAVAGDRRAGSRVYYGDATEPGFLEACGLQRARGVIITVQSRDGIDAVVERVRAMRPDILVISRARDADHALHLYAIGATDAVPETIEASLQLSEAALTGLGVPADTASASVHALRDELRRSLQQASREAGRSPQGAR